MNCKIKVSVHRSSFGARRFGSRLFAAGGPLADGFVKNYAGGDRDVERFDLPAQGDADEHVAALAHETPQPLALAAEQQGAGLRPVPVRVRGVGLGGGADGPDAAPLQLLQQPHDVGGARDGHVFERAGRGLRHRLGQARRAPLGDEDAVRARTLGRAYNRAEVARVFDAVEHDRERRVFGAHARGERAEQVVRARVVGGGDGRDDALVVGARGDALQLGAGHAADGDVGVARDLKNLAQPRLVRALGQRQALDGARARAQRFEHGLDAEDVRPVVRRLRPADLRSFRPACGLARLARTREGRAFGLGGAGRAFAPVLAREGARHALARRLAAAFGPALAPFGAAALPALLSTVLFHLFSARARSTSRWRSRA